MDLSVPSSASSVLLPVNGMVMWFQQGGRANDVPSVWYFGLESLSGVFSVSLFPMTGIFFLHPVPVDLKPRILSTMIDLDDATASLELVLSVAAYFEIKDGEARVIAKEVATAVANWRDVASAQGISANEIERMASAFGHDDLNLALES